MENFNRLSKEILSFKIGYERIEDDMYYRVNEPLDNKVWSDEYAILSSKAINDLLYLQTFQAVNLIKRLQNTAKALEKIELDIELDTFQDLIDVCMNFAISTGEYPTEGICEFDSVFLLELEQDIYARRFIIDRLWNLYQQITDEEGYKKRIESEKGKWKELINHNNGFGDYLKEEKLGLLPQLIEEYKDQRPQVIVSMIYALKELGYLSQELDSTKGNKRVLAESLSVTFEKNIDRQALIYNFKLYDEPKLDEKNKIDKEIRKIKTF